MLTAKQLHNGHGTAGLGYYQTIHDINGNDVGRYAIKPLPEA